MPDKNKEQEDKLTAKKIKTIFQKNKFIKAAPYIVKRRLFLLWVAIGILSGIIAAIYWITLSALLHFLASFDGLLVIPVMTFAGLTAGLIVFFIGDPGKLDMILDNIRFKGGKLDPKRNPSMILSSLITIAAGGSAGPEAPLVQVTGSTSSWIAEKFKLSGEDFRTLTIAGMAAGFTALFGAPLGGALFALEILHHKHVVEYYHAIIPAIVASAFSYVVFIFITELGVAPIWHIPVYPSTSLYDFFIAAIYGSMAAVAGYFFIYLFKLVKSAYGYLNFPIYIKMTVGGVILGVLAYLYPVTRYFGHDEINLVIEGAFTTNTLIAIFFVKTLAIVFTIASGWKGGFIIPLFYLGSVLGLILFSINLPFIPSHSVSLAIVACMASINAFVTRTPISTIILLSSLTGFDYFVPIMFASLTGFFLAPQEPFISSQKPVAKPDVAEIT